MPAFRGDVDIRNGKIVEMGKRRGSATPAIEVDGLGVAPDVVEWERTVW